MNVERAEGMRLPQPLPSETGPLVPRVGEELQHREARTCLKDGKVCHCPPVNIHSVDGGLGGVFEIFWQELKIPAHDEPPGGVPLNGGVRISTPETEIISWR